MGKEKGGDYLPFIPAQKVRLELEVHKDKWKSLRNIYARLGSEFVFQQNHPSEFEMPGAGYTLLNLGFGTDISVKKQYFTVGLFFNNLLNKTYMDHLSTLRDLGLNNMGRNVSVSVRIPFGIKN
jgi:iron complex outermembrane receptor protein